VGEFKFISVLGIGFSLEKQVVVGLVCHWSCTHSSRLISVESPAITLVFYNSFTDIPMVFDFNTFPFFQLHHLTFKIMKYDDKS